MCLVIVQTIPSVFRKREKEAESDDDQVKITANFSHNGFGCARGVKTMCSLKDS